MERNRIKGRIYITAMLILTAVYPLFMVIMSGAGLIYNRNSYGATLTAAGVLLTVSGAAMTAGAILSLPKKRITAVLSLILTAAGALLCLCMLHLLIAHADSAGWSDDRTMEPVSAMYRRRILPVLLPASMSAGTAVYRFLSCRD